MKTVSNNMISLQQTQDANELIRPWIKTTNHTKTFYSFHLVNLLVNISWPQQWNDGALHVLGDEDPSMIKCWFYTEGPSHMLYSVCEHTWWPPGGRWREKDGDVKLQLTNLLCVCTWSSSCSLIGQFISWSRSDERLTFCLWHKFFSPHELIDAVCCQLCFWIYAAV